MAGSCVQAPVPGAKLKKKPSPATKPPWVVRRAEVMGRPVMGKAGLTRLQVPPVMRSTVPSAPAATATPGAQSTVRRSFVVGEVTCVAAVEVTL